jgi:hypothetical protein
MYEGKRITSVSWPRGPPVSATAREYPILCMNRWGPRRLPVNSTLRCERTTLNAVKRSPVMVPRPNWVNLTEIAAAGDNGGAGQQHDPPRSPRPKGSPTGGL